MASCSFQRIKEIPSISMEFVCNSFNKLKDIISFNVKEWSFNSNSHSHIVNA